MIEDEDRIIDEVIGRLLEHFDSVRVFVTRHDGEAEATSEISKGAGNFLAQLGQIKNWVDDQDDERRAALTRFRESEDGDDE